jgi:hypothetical protein
MSKLITLGRFLLDHPRMPVREDTIHTMRSRAKKAGKPLPYPFVTSRGSGKDALVDLDAARAWAAAEGMSHIFEGGRGR